MEDDNMGTLSMAKLQIHIPDELKDQVRIEAALADISQSELVARALQDYFKKNAQLPKLSKQ